MAIQKFFGNQVQFNDDAVSETRTLVMPDSDVVLGQVSEIEGWNVKFGFARDSFNIETNAQVAEGIHIKPDGTEMYIANGILESIEQYTLGTAWDITSATHTASFDVTLTDTYQSTFDLYIRANGEDMYIILIDTTDSNWKVTQWSMGTPWDITTATFVAELDVVNTLGSTLTNNLTGIDFRTDGTKMYLCDSTAGGGIDQYTLSVPWDISSASLDKNIDFTAIVTNLTNETKFELKSDGTKIFVAGSDIVYQFSLETAWDIGTAVDDNMALDMNTLTTSTQSTVHFKSDGTRLFTTGDISGNRSVVEFVLDSKQRAVTHGDHGSRRAFTLYGGVIDGFNGLLFPGTLNPEGWTLTKNGTGDYTITHGLGIVIQSAPIFAQTNTPTASLPNGTAWVLNVTTISFDIQVLDGTSTNVDDEVAFYMIVGNE